MSTVIPGLPPASVNPKNINGLVSSPIVTNLAASKGIPTSFGPQEQDLLKKRIIQSATKTRLAKLLKEKAELIKTRVQLDIKHNIYVEVTLYNKKTPKKQIKNGKEVEIPPELTEEEYQTALIIENGGTLPNGQYTKGNYPTAVENIQKKQDENQKQIDEFLKDPFATQKAKIKALRLKIKARKKKTKAQRRAARKAKLKSILKNARKTLAPVIMIMLSNKIAEIIAQNDRIGKLVNDTNRIIQEANLSNNPTKLQAAKIARDNAIRIITDNENKLKRINSEISRIASYINIFSIIVNIISAIPIPTSVPPGIGIPTNLIIRFVKILDKANRIVLILSSYLPIVLSTLDRAISILIDYKSRLLNIGSIIDEAATSSITPGSFLTAPAGGNIGTENFPEYKGFSFALREENNPKFIVRGFKRKYAVAINQGGVEVLQSEYSFTLDPNDLIEQLKLLIDQQNLSSLSSNNRRPPGSTRSSSTNNNNSLDNSRFQLQTPSNENINKAKKAAFTQPPQPKVIKAGPFNQKIPLSVTEKAMYAGIAAASPEPSSKIGAVKILAEDRKWQAAFKRYQSQAGNDILKLES
jgi:hypothetical protein